MKTWVVVLSFIFNVCALAAPVKTSSDDWKGPSPLGEFSASLLGGLALSGSSVGGVVLGSVAKKVMNRGLIGGDINDQVFLEVHAGPEFISGTTALALSTHLRWDFNRDDDFAAFAVGGLGARFATGSNFVHPRFGIGALWYLEWFAARVEISERWILAGAHFAF